MTERATQPDRGNPQHPFTVIFAGGGTGGHFFPAVAVAEAIRERLPSSRILFAGTRRGIESRMAPRLGLDLFCLPVYGFVGLGVLSRIRSLLLLPVALLMAAGLCLRFRPAVVVGVGGYASLPVGLAAAILGVPLLLLEQNLEPGLSNRVLRFWATRVAVAFPQTLLYFPGKSIHLGNPVRSGLSGVPEPADGGPLRLLILGGSRGAHAVNEAVCDSLDMLKGLPGGLEVIHQTGSEDLARVRERYAQAGFTARVEPFLYNMHESYGWAQAVLCRAGATTLAELAVTGRAAVLVPFPHAAKNHQERNARGFEEQGAALCLLEGDLSSERLGKAMETLSDAGTRSRMGEAVRALGKPRAAEEIADLVLHMGEAA